MREFKEMLTLLLNKEQNAVFINNEYRIKFITNLSNWIPHFLFSSFFLGSLER
jgi:hypothetical protein